MEGPIKKKQRHKVIEFGNHGSLIGRLGLIVKGFSSNSAFVDSQMFCNTSMPSILVSLEDERETKTRTDVQQVLILDFFYIAIGL